MQNTSTSRSTDFQRQKTITSKTPLTLYGRGFCASDRTPTTTGSPAGSQSNQNVWVLPPISRNDRNKLLDQTKLLNRKTLGRSTVGLCCVFSSDPAVSSQVIFVGEEKEGV